MNIDKQYQTLLQTILKHGVIKQDRTGTGTKSIFGYTIRHNMKDGFPLLTTKKMPFKTIVTELLWFLRGDTNIKYLVDNNCHIWDGDAYQRYKTTYDIESREGSYGLEELHMLSDLTKEEFTNKIKTDDGFANKWGELGPIYGKQWRKWKRYRKVEDIEHKETLHIIDYIDQIANLIHDLKTNPDSRRLMVNAWNVGELDQMVLPPCHYGFQVYTRELSIIERGEIYRKKHPEKTIEDFPPGKMDVHKVRDIFNEDNIPTRAISLMWNQRSVDTFLGLPFNIASYGLLLEIIAKEVNMVPDELIGNLGDVHLYSNHIEQAKEQIGREYTSEERHEMLKTAMGDFYKTAVDEQVPFGGGMSEYYDAHKIPYRTREPFELPKLGMDYREGEYNKNLTGFVPDDFYLIDYQSHPTIKAPLSN